MREPDERFRARQERTSRTSTRSLLVRSAHTLSIRTDLLFTCGEPVPSITRETPLARSASVRLLGGFLLTMDQSELCGAQR